MSLNGFVFSVISVQLVPLLEAAGLATAAAVWVASMKGLAQFGGTGRRDRLWAQPPGHHRGAHRDRHSACVVYPLLVGTGNLPLVVAFTLLMGASQGVITIVRGAVPLALFGAKGYGAVLGSSPHRYSLSTPRRPPSSRGSSIAGDGDGAGRRC